MSWLHTLWVDHGESFIYGILLVGAVLYIFRFDGLITLGRRYGLYASLVIVLFAGAALLSERYGLAATMMVTMGLNAIRRLYKDRQRETNS